MNFKSRSIALRQRGWRRVDNVLGNHRLFTFLAKELKKILQITIANAYLAPGCPSLYCALHVDYLV